jgi:hypothetical protein
MKLRGAPLLGLYSGIFIESVISRLFQLMESYVDDA